MDSLTASETPVRQPPSRDDCWTAEATETLVDAWGRRYLELNRGNLRQKDWQEVAETVNALHGHTKKTRRTDVQCKNRIDTLKKKYKVEKAKIEESGGDRTSSSWPFFNRMALLIGSNSNKHQNKASPSSLPSPPMALPLPYHRVLPHAMVSPVTIPQKRPSSSSGLNGLHSLRNYSAMAAAAAASEEEDGESEGEEEEGWEERVECVEEARSQGMRKMAEAIEKIGEIYERVERNKLKQNLELEKQRMLFIEELEVQRMQWFTDALVQQHKKKQAKRSRASDDEYSRRPCQGRRR